MLELYNQDVADILELGARSARHGCAIGQVLQPHEKLSDTARKNRLANNIARPVLFPSARMLAVSGIPQLKS